MTMTEVTHLSDVRIGQLSAHDADLKRPTRPLKTLPTRLDLAACLQIIERIDPDQTASGIMAAGKQIDIDRLDNCLEFTDLDLNDRMTLKAALTECGLLPRGQRVS
jgi:hypothetical protein